MYNFIAKLLNFIESSTDHTKSEIVIAEYILKNVNDIPYMSIYQLAEACHTSPATITRFCRKFENITYKELKEYARTYIEFNYTEVDFQKLASKIDLDQVDQYFEKLQSSLNETKQLIHAKDILEVANQIHVAKKVSFFGVTFSHVLARNAQFKLLRLGKYATSYSNHENQVQEAESMTSEDLAIIFSFSGQTRFIVQLVKVLKKRGIPTVAITGNVDSFLAKNVTKIIPVSKQKISSYKSPILEEVNMQSVLNTIYLVYSNLLSSLE
jgi:DNA-binding MurR/RpiR family transcriptional regulator